MGQTICDDLRICVRQLNERGLYNATRWAAELLSDLEDSNTSTPSNSIIPKDSDNDIKESDLYLRAKSYFDLKEFYRTSHVLLSCSGSKSSFLRRYSLYLAGEKKKEEELCEQQNGNATNRELKQLKEELSKGYADKQLDGFNMWLYGVVLKEFGMRDDAREVLIESVNQYPWNWSAWTDLASLFTEQDAASYVTTLKQQLNAHWMKDFFMANLALELQQNDEALNLYETLLQKYPKSQHVLSQMAVANYNLREFDIAEEIFEGLLEKDPYRLEGMDVFSNILYVKENKSKLSFLAHKASDTDKYRPETCCIIGNYYSIKSDHEKAVVYFQRALKLNRKFLSAWTLMGHEFVEMKNTRAAVEAYRKAVDINPRDYRAWYGLGQTYEILKMPLYSIYYYTKATTLRPYDARMWCALGTCYDQLNRTREAIKCYERAVSNGDQEGIALNKLAKLYQKMHEDDKAAFYYKKNLDLREQEGVEGPDTIDAILFLATYCKNKGRFTEAANYCSRLLDYTGKAKEDGKALLRELHSIQKSGSEYDQNNSSLDMSM